MEWSLESLYASRKIYECQKLTRFKTIIYQPNDRTKPLWLVFSPPPLTRDSGAVCFLLVYFFSFFLLPLLSKKHLTLFGFFVCEWEVPSNRKERKTQSRSLCLCIRGSISRYRAHAVDSFLKNVSKLFLFEIHFSFLKLFIWFLSFAFIFLRSCARIYQITLSGFFMVLAFFFFSFLCNCSCKPLVWKWCR